MLKYLLSFLLLTQWAIGQATLRNTFWNMTKAEVMAAEKNRPTANSGNSLTYSNLKLGNLAVSLVYTFAKVGLIEGAYLIDEKHADAVGYYEDYRTLLTALIQKYGEPTNLTRWRNNLYESDPQHYGLAASLGHVTFLQAWEKGPTLINLVLSGDNYKCNVGIVYRYRFAPEEAGSKLDLKDF